MSERSCDGCGRAGDLVQVYQTRGNDYYELWLCERCATVLGVDTENELIGPTPEELLGGLINTATLSCPGCGTSFQSISRHGAVGCAECYRTFAGKIELYMEEIGMPTRHSGRFPERLASYKRLLLDRELFRDELKRAIEAEDYERAAALRDELIRLDGDSDAKR
jgi:protein arginine kinase activator